MRDLAHRVDRAVFAPAEPTEADVASAWALSDTVLAEHDDGGTRLRRLLARLNPASFARR
jgi:hypothetical protein